MGIISCLAAAIITFNISNGQWVFILEELLKALFALVLVLRKKIVFFVEALVYGATIGSGFALVENIVYLYYNPDMLIGTALFRGLSTALLHMGCTAIMAIALLFIKYSIHSTFNTIITLLPFIIHYCYNYAVLTIGRSEGGDFAILMLMIVTILSFLVIFLLISLYNERKIYQWLDHSITFDIQLLAAIREGHLADTRSGQYLCSIKEQFQSDVFFDLICFIQLYLELSIAGKSRLLLEQEGLAQPLTKEQISIHNEKIAELCQLRHNIGPLGEYLIRPIITINDQDLRIM